MFTMALAGRVVTDWAGDPGAVVEYGVRFTRPVPVPDDDEGADVEVTGKVDDKLDDGRVRVDLTATHQGAKVLSRAQAVVRWPRPGGRAGAADVPFADFTTLRLGGPARRLVTAEPTPRSSMSSGTPTRRGEPLLVLGGGSNLVVGDEGFDGTVLQVATRGVAVAVGAEHALQVEAGDDWDRLVALAVEEDLAGVEACPASRAGSVPRRSRTSAPTARRWPDDRLGAGPTTAAPATSSCSAPATAASATGTASSRARRGTSCWRSRSRSRTPGWERRSATPSWPAARRRGR